MKKTMAISLSFTAILAASCNSDNGTDSGTANYSSCTPAASAQSRLAAQMIANPMLQTMKKTPSHIPLNAKNGIDLGALPSAQLMPVTIALALNNEDELNERLSQIYQPGHPNYRKYMTQAEFSERYAPTPAQIIDAESFLSQHGIEVSSVGPSGLTIHAQASAAILGEAFQTEIHQYQSASNATGYAPAYEPRMPAGLTIQAVHGLESPMRLKHHAVAQVASVAPLASSGSAGGLTPAAIHAAYGIPTSLSGTGQTIAIVELDGFKQADVTTYESAYGLGATPITVEKIAGATGAAGADSDEVTLDIELTAAVAPGANIKVFEAPNSTQSLLSIYEAIAADSSINEVSISWGMDEADFASTMLQTESGVFRQMAALGMSVYAASGDTGADANGGSLSVEDPSTQPFVVAVGGTHLVTGTGGSYVSESTWDNSGSNASGGGVSQVWGLPSWQAGVANPKNLASAKMRNVPDVSLNADPNTGYAIYLNGGWVVYGGTSCAAPIWTAFTALVNQKRESTGLASLGFVDPYLYSIGGTQASYRADFHDIADGSSNGHYPAVSGYDDATGWGSINGGGNGGGNGNGLFNDLSTEPEHAMAGC